MERVVIEHESDVVLAQRAARKLADLIGFEPLDAAQIAIVASELATNILKHGIYGRMEMDAFDDRDRGAGIRIVAFDHGPQFRAFDLALRDGFDDRGPLDPANLSGRRGHGAGLGAVQRLTDAVSCEPRDDGKAVIAVRYVVRPRLRKA